MGKPLCPTRMDASIGRNTLLPADILLYAEALAHTQNKARLRSLSLMSHTLSQNPLFKFQPDRLLQHFVAFHLNNPNKNVTYKSCS